MWAFTGQQARWPVVSHQTTGTVIRALVTRMCYNIKISQDRVVPLFFVFLVLSLYFIPPQKIPTLYWVQY